MNKQLIKKFRTADFFEYHPFSGTLSELLESPKALISTINQYSFCIAETDPFFKKALCESEILLPDGVAITASLRFLSGRKVKKIAGADLHHYLLRYLEKKGGKCFYLGSSAATLEKIRIRLKKEFPNIKAGFYSPPYKSVFLHSDSQKMIEQANAFQPEVLFIGMTAPKQEKWAYEFKNQLDARLICSIGAVFDFYAGTVQRPGTIWINLGLEWLGRLLSEPKRLWKRYLYYGPIFVCRILLEKMNHLFRINQKLQKIK